MNDYTNNLNTVVSDLGGHASHHGVYSADKHLTESQYDSASKGTALNQSVVSHSTAVNQDFTEVFSWGSDRHG